MEWRGGIAGQGVPHPQSVSSITTETHGREEKHREKEKSTKTGETLVSKDGNKTVQTDDVITTQQYCGLDFEQTTGACQKAEVHRETDCSLISIFLRASPQ